MALRIEAGAAPVLTQIRVFSSLDSEGAPENTVLLYRCGHGGMFTSHERCGFVRKNTQDGEGWEMDMPLPAASGSYYIRVWATWKDFGRPEAGPYSVNWSLAVDV